MLTATLYQTLTEKSLSTGKDMAKHLGAPAKPESTRLVPLALARPLWVRAPTRRPLREAGESDVFEARFWWRAQYHKLRVPLPLPPEEEPPAGEDTTLLAWDTGEAELGLGAASKKRVQGDER